MRWIVSVSLLAVDILLFILMIFVANVVWMNEFGIIFGKIWEILHFPMVIPAKIIIDQAFAWKGNNWLLGLFGYGLMFFQTFVIGYIVGLIVEKRKRYDQRSKLS